MNKTFGGEFIIANDVYQPMPSFKITPTGKHYMHLATVHRGFKEYMAYLDQDANKVWIEWADPSDPNLLRVIEDDNEWTELKDFLFEAGLLEIRVNKEIPLASPKSIFNG